MTSPPSLAQLPPTDGDSFSTLTEGEDVRCGACAKPGKFSRDSGLRNRFLVIHGEEKSDRPAADRSTTKTCFLIKAEQRNNTTRLTSATPDVNPDPLPNHEFPRGGTGAAPLSSPADLPEFADLATDKVPHESPPSAERNYSS